MVYVDYSFSALKRISLTILLLMLINMSTFSQRREMDLSGSGWKMLMDRDTVGWKSEELFLPDAELSKINVHPPTGGWQILSPENGISVQVPGSVEEYLPRKAGPANILKGVSWWYKDIDIPVFKGKPVIRLKFESTFYRAEIFVNRQFVGYNLVAGAPTDVDISKILRPGLIGHIAVRITNPGGYLDWRDMINLKWGKYQVPREHGFSGITGRVKLIMTDRLYTDDIYVQNTPAPTTVVAHISIINNTEKPLSKNLSVKVVEKKAPFKVVCKVPVRQMLFKAGLNEIPITLTAISAKLWGINHPELYECKVELSDHQQVTDQCSQTFGFRWFDVKDVGQDAKFILNGKRIVLRTAISWSFWPDNGVYPSLALARKQVSVAQSMGLNMLNFHRCIGQPIVFEQADQMGLLYYEEPGNYLSGVTDPFANALVREKLLRMVKRDRSHPSLVIYNMQNEMRPVDSAMLISQVKDMKGAHQIDPSRIITRTSGWAATVHGEDQAKIHMRPFDTTVYKLGWYDYHHAPGPPTWNQTFYHDPKSYYDNTENKTEIVYWGEEGAISAPPRLQLIRNELSKKKLLGWDGKEYLQQFATCDSFLTAKNLRSTFADVDAFTTALGKISFDHQGRKIETIRINNITDGYAINGWEAEVYENHSGIVDCFRNPKADPKIIAHYNQPFFVAVKIRNQVLDLPGKVVFDLFAVNELNKKGPYTLDIVIKNPQGAISFQKKVNASLTGGDTFGELLAKDVSFPLEGGSAVGMYNISVRLINDKGQEEANGSDGFFAVDWRGQQIKGNGAVFENGTIVKDFLRNKKLIEVPEYADSSKKLDWIVVTHSPQFNNDLVPVPTEQLRIKDGQTHGITATFFEDANFGKKVATREKSNVNLIAAEGATPDPDVKTTENYSILWEGTLLPAFTGIYKFQAQFAGTIEVEIDHQKVIEGKSQVANGSTALEKGKPVSLIIRYKHEIYAGMCRLLWSPPDPVHVDITRLLDRVKNDGTKLILLENSAEWMSLITANMHGVSYNGKFTVGGNWVGGSFFARKHRLFNDLPTNQALNWPYQAVVENANDRVGLLLGGDDMVAGAYHSYPFKLGSAVGIIPLGKGHVIFSTLNIANALISDEQPTAVAKKLLINYINY